MTVSLSNVGVADNQLKVTGGSPLITSHKSCTVVPRSTTELPGGSIFAETVGETIMHNLNFKNSLFNDTNCTAISCRLYLYVQVRLGNCSNASHHKHSNKPMLSHINQHRNLL